MSPACIRFRFWLDDDAGREPDSAEQRAREAHLLECPDCREEMKGIVVQSATVNAVFRSAEAPPALPASLVKGCVEAMRRAARGGSEQARSSG